MRVVTFLFLALAIIAADQLSKWYVMEHMIRPRSELPVTPQVPGVVPPTIESKPIDLSDMVNWYSATPPRTAPNQVEVLSHFNIVSVWNKGISFGMFNKASDYGPIILVALSVVVSLFFLLWLFRNPDPVQSAGIVMVIGGAMGNVIDRLRFGAVFDFLDFHAFDYHWPAFNIADSGIVIGVAVLIFHSFFIEQKVK